MNTMRYAVLRTRWGYFGLVADGRVVCRSYLPLPDAGRMDSLILGDIGEAAGKDNGLMPRLQERIRAYFEGENADFSTDPDVSLAQRSAFDQAVLAACRQIGPGQRTTYGRLAEKIGRPGAARAVGAAMARNPVPLIIPCHRVLRSDGALGGFSAFGGVNTKRKMLEHERIFRESGPGLFAACPAIQC